MEQSQEKSGNEEVLFLDDSNSCPIDIKESGDHIMTNLDGNSKIFPLASTTPHFEEKLMRDEKTNKLYLPLTSTVDLKRRQEMLYVALDFGKIIAKDALVDSGARVIAQNELDTTKQKALNDIFKIDDNPNFQTQVANGQ